MRKRFLTVIIGLSVLTNCKPVRSEQDSASLKDTFIVKSPVDLKTEEFCFDVDKGMPEDAQKGLRTVFASLGFRMLVEENLFQRLINLDPQRQWIVYGKPPSPASRRKLGPVQN